MKITINELKGLIKKLIKEQTDDYDTGSSGGPLWDLDPYDLLQFAKAYASLGRAVQEQLDDLVDDPTTADINANAVDLIAERLGGQNEQIDYAVEEWKESAGTAEED
jgi:hypothetical protein